jgi:hypothetical protein
MSVYLQSTTEENLYLCIINGLWGSNTNRLSHWAPSDRMIVYVERELAALFTITGSQFQDEMPIWPGDAYPYRVNIQLEKIIHPDDRYSISNLDTREALFEHHTSAYGVVLVLGAKPLDEEPAELLLRYIQEAPAWEDFDASHELQLLREQQAEHEEAVVEEIVQARPEEPDEDLDYSHTRIQYYLATLGQSLGFDIWVPKNDQGRRYNDVSLGSVSLEELPSLPFNDYVIRIVKNIDVIWLSNGNPVHLFEVERTTSIYSGLLRMSDLVTLIPMINIQMYICASRERKAKVAAEVTRPTFDREPLRLADRCRFISFEGLVEFIEARSDILTHLRMSIMNELSEPIERQIV